MRVGNRFGLATHQMSVTVIRRRRCALRLAGGALARAAVVEAGALLARDTGPVRAVTPLQSPTASRAPALAGKGPIGLSI